MRIPLIQNGVVVNAVTLADDAEIITEVELAQRIAEKQDVRKCYVLPAEHIAGPEGGEIGDTWDGANYIKPPDPEPGPPTTDDVIAERARRLALGFDYDFGDARGVHRIGTTESDMKGWDEVTKISNAFLAIGETDATIQIETDTGPTQVTALEWQYILIAAAQFRQPIWLASFALQKMDPIPGDYTDDKWWPPAA